MHGSMNFKMCNLLALQKVRRDKSRNQTADGSHVSMVDLRLYDHYILSLVLLEEKTAVLLTL